MGASVIVTTPDGVEHQVGRGMNRRWFTEYDRLCARFFPDNGSWKAKSRRQHKRRRYQTLLKRWERARRHYCKFRDKESFLKAHLPLCVGGYTPGPSILTPL